MKFVVDTKEFLNSLKLVQAVVNSKLSTTLFALEATKSGLWLYASDDTITLKCNCKGISDLEGKGVIGIDLSIIDNIFKGRNDFKLETQENVLRFEGVKSSYNGKIVIIPITEDTIESLNSNLAFSKKADSSKLTEDTFTKVLDGLDAVKIAAVHSSDPLDTFMKLNKGVLEVASSDNFHVAFNTTKCESDASFQLSTTKSTFEILAKFMSVYPGATELVFGEESIKAKNKDYLITLPNIQSSDSAFVRTKQYIENLPKATCSFKLKLSGLSNILSNLMSIYEEGALITFSKKKANKLELSISTTYGNISDNLEIEDFKGEPFKDTFDPRMIIDILTAAKGDNTTLSYIKDKCFILRCQSDVNKSSKSIYACTIVR
jgi:DNA polymerase III sliding clamp (beta) subunit (PCNA family)